MDKQAYEASVRRVLEKRAKWRQGIATVGGAALGGGATYGITKLFGGSETLARVLGVLGALGGGYGGYKLTDSLYKEIDGLKSTNSRTKTESVDAAPKANADASVQDTNLMKAQEIIKTRDEEIKNLTKKIKSLNKELDQERLYPTLLRTFIAKNSDPRTEVGRQLRMGTLDRIPLSALFRGRIRRDHLPKRDALEAHAKELGLPSVEVLNLLYTEPEQWAIHDKYNYKHYLEYAKKLPKRYRKSFDDWHASGDNESTWF